MSAQTRGVEGLVDPVVQCKEYQRLWILRQQCLISRRYSNVQCVSIMSFHPSCNVKVDTSCAPIVDPSFHAARPAVDLWGTSVTWLWRKWQVMLCFHVNTPIQGARSPWCIRIKLSMKRAANSARTRVPARAHPANGKAAWTRWCPTWWCHTRVSQPYKEKT